ncbi:MAG: hypothetical protein HFI76_05385 [Lachnospiraceae bacterium]|nr:hypothetical protein [Lachnospiraceae bacterium]
MKLIHKKNVIPIICITYTVLSIVFTIFEISVKREMNPTQLNLFLFFLLSVLGVGVLSQHYRLERFSPLAMMVIQYLIAIAVILISLKAASYVTDIHPNGYRDLTVSFSIPYVIGAIIYYIHLWLQVRKQNRILEKIKRDKL